MTWSKGTNLGGVGTAVLAAVSGGDSSTDAFGNPLYGNAGANVLYGNRIANTIYGNAGADVLYGNKAKDTLYGNADADVLYGNQGADTIYGNKGTDTIYGNKGADALYGFLNDDVIFGGKANDLIFGGKGSDRISGGRGDDTIWGDQGADVLVGGPGADVFVIAPGTGGASVAQSDLIVDFTLGEDFVRLTKGLTLEALSIATDGGNTVIQDRTTGEIFAVLQGVEIEPPPVSNLPDPEIIRTAPVETIDPPFPAAGTGIERPVIQDPGNTLEAALDIAGSSETFTYRDQVGASDPDDFYAFSVGASSNLALSLTGLSHDAELFLLDSAGNVIQASEGPGTADEVIAQSLEDGIYTIQVKAFDPDTTDYALNVTLISSLPGITTDFSDAVFEPTTYESSRAIRLEPSITDNGTFLQGFRNNARFVGIDGRGFSTVILDTGIDLDHPFFGPDTDGNGIADRIVHQQDFADNDFDASDGGGARNHGSNVSSIVASQDEFETGMAPGANIIHLKVFPDDPNNGDVINPAIQNALQWVARNADRFNIASVNMSLGGKENYQSASPGYLSDELLLLRLKNVIVVASAGNEFSEYGGVPGIGYPAADPHALAVSATWDENVGSIGGDFTTGAFRITSFSQRHPDLTDIFAPGGLITGANADGGTVDQSGTSQAAPHIAGIAVLAQQLAVQEMGRRLTFDEFRNALIQSAEIINDGDDEDDNVPNTGLNYRQVNVQALGEYILALARAENPPPPPPPPIAKTQYNFIYIYDGAMGTSNENYVGYTYAPPDTFRVGTLYDPSSAPNERGTNGAYFIISEQPAPTEALLGQVFVERYTGAAIPRPNSSSAAIPYYFSVGSPSGFSGLGSEIDFAQTRDAAGDPILEQFGADYWAADVRSVATDIGP